MSTATATAPPTPETLGEYRAIFELKPSPLNPRKTYDPQKLQELAASIRQKGVIEPLIVRPSGAPNVYEIVAGERRYRAAKLAELDVLPVIVRPLADLEVLELMVIENKQREDVHPLEEAEAFVMLKQLDGAYTPKAIAAKVGISERYVQNRLHYAVLIPEAKAAFLKNEITAGHADLIARLKPEDQERALKSCFQNLYGDDKERGVCSVRDLDRWIKENVRLDVTPASTELPLLEEEQPEIKTVDLSQVVQVRGYGMASDAAMKGVLGPSDYRVISGKKDRCAHVERALIVLGDDRGTLVTICRAKTVCVKHFKYAIETAKTIARQEPSGKPASSPRKASAQAKEEAAMRQAEDRRRSDALKQGAKTLEQLGAKLKPGPELLAFFVALHLGYSAKNTWGGLAGSLLRDNGFISDWAKVARLVKPLGVDLVAIEKALAAKDKKPAAAKKAKARR